jgi:hypothetical protein
VRIVGAHRVVRNVYPARALRTAADGRNRDARIAAVRSQTRDKDIASAKSLFCLSRPRRGLAQRHNALMRSSQKPGEKRASMLVRYSRAAMLSFRKNAAVFPEESV